MKNQRHKDKLPRSHAEDFRVAGNTGQGGGGKRAHGQNGKQQTVKITEHFAHLGMEDLSVPVVNTGAGRTRPLAYAKIHDPRCQYSVKPAPNKLF
jgi:hypothetical protein